VTRDENRIGPDCRVAYLQIKKDIHDTIGSPDARVDEMSKQLGVVEVTV
jgi:hypothetical protein